MQHSIQQAWQEITYYAQQAAENDLLMKDFFEAYVLAHNGICEALAYLLSDKLTIPCVPPQLLRDSFSEAFSNVDLQQAMVNDLYAVKDRDGACSHIAVAFLFFKGFHAIQTHRCAHYFFQNNHQATAYLLQSYSSSTFDVDIHPAAKIGTGLMLDHATGIVIGETATVGDNVSIMQSVTLGGTGKDDFDRHPKVGNGVLISCGAKILGNIHIGDGAKVAAGSVVLKPVAEHTTVAGVPASVVGSPAVDSPSLNMNHNIDCSNVNQFLKAPE